jgi:uncharacterized protein (UPF0548 family)
MIRPVSGAGATRPFGLRRPDDQTLTSLVAAQTEQALTYPEIGATRGDLPPGYRHDHWSADLGPDQPGVFERAAEVIRTWGVQRGAGLLVYPGSPVRDSATFALVIPLPMGYVTAAGRVVYVLDEPGRSGFGYGTLPCHPERGEEAFAVTRRGGRIRFEITAFSRPGHPLARIGTPVTRLFQRRVTKAYLEAMRRAMAEVRS